MSTSLRNKLFPFLVGSVIIFSLKTATWAETIDDVDVDILAGAITAGQTSNNTVVTVFFELTDNVDPTTLTLSLLDGGTVIPNALSITTLETDEDESGPYTPPIKFYRAGTNSLILRATTPNGVVGDSDPFTVGVGAASKLILLSEEQTLLQGRDPSTSPKSGTPTIKPVGSEFPLTVYLTDDQFNRVSGTDLVTISGGDYSTFNPASVTLDNGRATFLVTINAPNVTEDYIVTSGGYTAGTLSITSAGPEVEKVGARPSPFNPRQGPITFEYALNEAKTVVLKVTDQYGQRVWEKSDDGEAFSFNPVEWNGKNDEGTYVAAGAYYVLLEIGGSVKSKKKFGVKK